MEFRERRVAIEIEWMYIPIGALCPRSPANSGRFGPSELGFILFLVPVGARSNPVATYRSSARSACLALMRLFCAFQLIPLRERQADGRGKERTAD